MAFTCETVLMTLTVLAGYLAILPLVGATPAPVPVGLNEKFLVPTAETILTYHNGSLLTAESPLQAYAIWYGYFSDTQKNIVREFFSSFDPKSFSGQSTYPTVYSWWSLTAGYRDLNDVGVPQRVHLAGEFDDAAMSIGDSITKAQLAQFLTQTFTSAALPADPSVVYFVLTANNVSVESFCISCSFHDSLSLADANGSSILYAWVGNSINKCPGVCAWPFAQANYGPALQLTSPNNDVGLDGMIINIGTMLAGMVTNPEKSGYYQGDADQPMEAGTACSGIFGPGAYAGYPGQLYRAPDTNASFNAVGISRKYLLPALWLPANSTCTPPPLPTVA